MLWLILEPPLWRLVLSFGITPTNLLACMPLRVWVCAMLHWRCSCVSSRRLCKPTTNNRGKQLTVYCGRVVRVERFWFFVGFSNGSTPTMHSKDALQFYLYAQTSKCIERRNCCFGFPGCSLNSGSHVYARWLRVLQSDEHWPNRPGGNPRARVGQVFWCDFWGSRLLLA